MTEDKSVNRNNLDEKQKQAVATALFSVNNLTPEAISDDKELARKDTVSIAAHDDNYNKILKSYVTNTRFNVWSKIFFKIVFFIVAVACMVAILVLFYKIVNFAIGSLQSENMIALLITGTATFLTTFIAIPVAITKYLFNSKEDESMTEIIKNLQVYDLGIRNTRKNK